MRADCVKPNIAFITKSSGDGRQTLSPAQLSHKPAPRLPPQPNLMPWTGKLCEQRGPKDLFETKGPARRETRKPIDGQPVENPDAYPHQNTTPPGTMDMSRVRYEIEGKTYEKYMLMGPKGPETKWFEVTTDGFNKPQP